jgi:hypothetical protein
MKTGETKIYLTLCALALAAFVVVSSAYAANPYKNKETIMGIINLRGELVADDGRVFVIANFKNLGNDWMGQEVEVTGYVSKPMRASLKNRVDRNAVQIILYHVIGTPTWWDNCEISCEAYDVY